MGAAIVRQPNGLLMRFSTNSDQVTHYDMTEEEYIALRVKQAKKEAKADAKRVIAEVREHGTSAWRQPFYYDFDEAMRLHKKHGGETFEMRET